MASTLSDEIFEYMMDKCNLRSKKTKNNGMEFYIVGNQSQDKNIGVFIKKRERDVERATSSENIRLNNEKINKCKRICDEIGVDLYFAFLQITKKEFNFVLASLKDIKEVSNYNGVASGIDVKLTKKDIDKYSNLEHTIVYNFKHNNNFIINGIPNFDNLELIDGKVIEGIETSDNSKSSKTEIAWFVSANINNEDQTQRFINEGIWENGYKDKHVEIVNSINVGDKIAIKSTYNTRKNQFPFNNNGRLVSVMEIKL